MAGGVTEQMCLHALVLTEKLYKFLELWKTTRKTGRANVT